MQVPLLRRGDEDSLGQVREGRSSAGNDQARIAAIARRQISGRAGSNGMMYAFVAMMASLVLFTHAELIASSSSSTQENIRLGSTALFLSGFLTMFYLVDPVSSGRSDSVV